MPSQLRDPCFEEYGYSSILSRLSQVRRCHAQHLDQITAGDQLRGRGVRSADGTELAADEVVSGTFRNIAGTVISTDAAAQHHQRDGSGIEESRDLANYCRLPTAKTPSDDCPTYCTAIARGIPAAGRLRCSVGPSAARPVSPCPTPAREARVREGHRISSRC